jgi:mannose-1-phosphate guanylyltransferase
VLHVVIMAGGSGTRFWPESRRARPKQFLQLAGDRTLIQATLDRCAPLAPPAGYWVVTNQAHAEETRRQLPNVPPEQILLEPCGRNTAPCIGLAALHLLAIDRDPIMLVVPADHIITTNEQFQEGVAAAVEIVEQEPQTFVLFGVKPTYPSTGFGYIQRGTECGMRSGECGVGETNASISHSALRIPHSPSAYRVAAFREKPDLATAQQYLASGDYYWNCGIFVWRARAVLDALHAFEPVISARLKALQPSLGTPGWPQALAEQFSQMPSISIDYAVLERTRDVCVLEAPFTWDDVGSWQALSRWNPPDAHGNTVDGPFCGVEVTDSIIRTTDDHLVAAYGVENLIIVHTPTATLVADKLDENALRKLIAELERQGLTGYL